SVSHRNNAAVPVGSASVLIGLRCAVLCVCVCAVSLSSRALWHDGRRLAASSKGWVANDVVGCLLNLDERVMSFYVNGGLAVSHKMGAGAVVDALCPTATLLAGTTTRFRFKKEMCAHFPKDETVRALEMGLEDGQKMGAATIAGSHANVAS